MTRPGFALVFVLLVIAAVELLTLTTLALATHETAIADTRLRTALATREADAALASLIRSWAVPRIDSLRIGQSIVIPGGNQVSIEVQRTAWGLYYATASAAFGRTSIRRAAVLRKLDADRGRRESTAAIVGELENDFPATYALAGVQWDELAGIADTIVNASIALAATDSTGKPIYPLIYADGDLTITGGSGQGLIFVRGILQLHAGVRFRGIIVVRETLVIDDDVELEGTLHTRSNQLSNFGRARISYSSDAVATALLETPAATRLIRGARTFIPAF